MKTIADILIALIAVVHLLFLYLEMFLWTRPVGLKVFGRTEQQAKESASLAANQGLYNGFLAAGLGWGLFHPNPEVGHQLKVFFLLCVLAAGIFGTITASRKILFMQALPAAVALGLILS